MERNTKVLAKELKPGDRFYKVVDKKRTVLEMVEHDAKKTHFQTYKYWCIPDGRDKRYPTAVKGGYRGYIFKTQGH